MFDDLNRMTRKTVPDGCPRLRVNGDSCPSGAATRDVFYDYDLAGHMLAARFDSGTGSDRVEDGYDALGRRTSTLTSMAGTSRRISFAYDVNATWSTIAHPDGNVFRYDVDPLGRLKRIWENGGTPVTSLSYDGDGRLDGAVRGSVVSSYGHDDIGRLHSVGDDLAGEVADQTTTIDAYNPAGQIAQVTKTNDRYRFTGSSNANRGYTTNGLNQYTRVGGATLAYDPNGNLTNDGTTGYGYDAENRLASASSGVELTYDPLGRLWQLSGPSGVTQFLYDGDRLTAEYGGGGDMLRRYVHGTRDDDPMLWYEGSGLGDRRSLQVDHQGSIASVADAGGDAIAINTYDEYGIPAPANAGRFQYTGQAFLSELGLYHYKARLYSPRLGRFMQTDPVGYDDQTNLYAYVGNDPMNQTDPSGRERCQGTEGACAKIAAGAERTREMASRTPSGSELRKTASTIGGPGEGTLIIPRPEMQDLGNFNAEAATGGAIVVGSNTLNASADLIGGVIAHEGTHKRDFDEHDSLKSGRERLETERHAYGVENEYRKAQGWAPRPNGVEADAKRSFDKACESDPNHPSCR